MRTESDNHAEDWQDEEREPVREAWEVFSSQKVMCFDTSGEVLHSNEGS